MELQKTYQGSMQLKEWKYMPGQEIELPNQKAFPGDLKKRLDNYLLDNNLSVRIIETYDAQSGWRGFSFIIGQEDISVNGFCYSHSNLDAFLKKTKTQVSPIRNIIN